jgi:hypothetical protein
VLAFADVMDLLTDELAGLCGRRPPGTLQLTRTIDGGFFGHMSPPELLAGATQMPNTAISSGSGRPGSAGRATRNPTAGYQIKQ